MSVVTVEAWGVEDDALERYAATRDPALRDELVERHLPLVKFVARKMSANLPSNVEMADLVSLGCLGLMDAIEKFEPAQGNKFSTYAVWRIKGDILDGLQKMEWAPKQVVSKVRAVKRASETLAITLGREPTVAELAIEMGDTEAHVLGYLRDAQDTRVRPLPDASDSEAERNWSGGLWGATHADQEVAGEAAEICARVATTLGTLDVRSRDVLLLYYQESKTLREIAAELGVSVSSATQLHTRLVDHVRCRLSAHGPVAA